MQVNLFPGQEPLPVSSPHVFCSLNQPHHPHPSLPVKTLESQLADAGDMLAFSHKAQVSNNNHTASFSKEIFTIAQGTDKPINNLKVRRLNFHEHTKTILQTAKQFCVEKEFVDVNIQCEDGIVAAHAIILSCVSPFLKRLLQTETATGPAFATESSLQHRSAIHTESVILVLPEVKTTLVQALLELLYTGCVTMQEGQINSLMKLVYDLDINASIEAEKTSDPPTLLDIRPVTVMSKSSCQNFDWQSATLAGDRPPQKRARMDTFDSTFNALFESSSCTSINSNSTSTTTTTVTSKTQSAGSKGTNSATPQESIWPKSGGLVVNSLTASGVEVKQEPEEKPSLNDDNSHGYEEAGVRGATVRNAAGNGIDGSLSSNHVNNNQLSHFVSVNPGYQVKLELPQQTIGQLSNSSAMLRLTSPPQNTAPTSATAPKDPSNPDDPLAAIMNQTIFGGEGLNMFIQVNGNNVAQYVNSSNNPKSNPSQPTLQQQPQQPPPLPPSSSASCSPSSSSTQTGPPQPLSSIQTSETEHRDSVATSSAAVESRPMAQCQDTNSSLEDGSGSLPEDEDNTSSYNCDTCNRVMKGKVMLQAHKYQEHHENPEFEATSFPDDKYACRVCLKLFTRNSDVKAHILRVHCGDRRYPCTVCGKRFKESTHLRKHLYTHTGERPHFCSYCSKGFQTSSDLKRHKKTRVHQERVDQCNAERSHPTPQTPTDKNIDATLDFNRWNEADDEELENTLNSAASRTTSSPFGSLGSGRSQTSTPPTLPLPPPPPSSSTSSSPTLSFSGTANSILDQHPGVPRSHSGDGMMGGNSGSNIASGNHTNNHLSFTTATLSSSSQQFLQLPSRISSGTLVFTNQTSPLTQMAPGSFLADHLPAKNHWPPGLMPSDGSMQTEASQPALANNIGLSSSPLADVLSVLPAAQNLGVQNLTLPSTTLDLSDIKWGILDPTVSAIKRSGSTDATTAQEEERLTIQEDL